ncbi:MAG: HNH endonuclease [Actinomycetota bacterium]|nr:HNH endonuclease [Actinomycetota bacterium]
MRYRSPSHRWADILGRPDDLVIVAAAAELTGAALAALDRGDLDHARRLWSAVDGGALLGLWNDQVRLMKAHYPLPIDPPATPDGWTQEPKLSRSLSLAVFDRDGYRCRYCGIAVFTQWQRGHIPQLVAAMPDLTPAVTVHNGSLSGSGKSGTPRNVDQTKWLWIQACADHVVPESHFGPTALDNLVTSCAGCNYGKMDWTLEQLDVIDPRSAGDPPA